MNAIELDASTWKNSSDFYRDILKKIGAPSWHGLGVNALVDSVLFGGVNALSKPYSVRVYNLNKTNDDVRDEVQFVFEALAGVIIAGEDGVLNVVVS